MTRIDRPILVTGGAGYIGSHTVLALRDAGYAVVVLDNLSTGTRSLVPSDVPLVIADIADGPMTKNILAEYKPRAVIHFAGLIINEESIREPDKYYRNNSEGSEKLIRACADAGIDKFIFSSSAAVYGNVLENPLTERTPPAPVTPYGHSKLLTEQSLQKIAQTSTLRFVALRYFNACGADPQRRSGQISKVASHLIKIACEAAIGKRAHVQIFGTDYPTDDGTCIRDYVHVSDLAAAHLAALERLLQGGSSLIANVGYGHGYSVREVLSAMKKSVPELVVLEANRRMGDVPHLVADNRLIRAELGWEPRHDNLSEIIASALDWERSGLVSQR